MFIKCHKDRKAPLRPPDAPMMYPNLKVHRTQMFLQVRERRDNFHKCMQKVKWSRSLQGACKDRNHKRVRRYKMLLELEWCLKFRYDFFVFVSNWNLLFTNLLFCFTYFYMNFYECFMLLVSSAALVALIFRILTLNICMYHLITFIFFWDRVRS